MKKKWKVVIGVIIAACIIGGSLGYLRLRRKPKEKKPWKGENLEITYLSANAKERKVAQVLKEEWSKLGFEVNPRGMDWSSQWSLARGDPQKAQDVFIFYWWPTYLTGYDYLYNMFHSYTGKPIFQLAYYNNSKFDSYIDRAYSQEGINKTKANQLYRKAENILVKDAPYQSYWYEKFMYVVREEVEGIKFNKAYPEYFDYYKAYPKEDTGDDTLKRAFDSDVVPTTMDPALDFSNEICFMHAVYQTLLNYNPAKKQLEPELAYANWTTSNEGKAYTFWLHKGVTFHDGAAFNATAVKWSIGRTIEMGGGAAFIWASVKNITTFEDNPYKVRFNLKYPAPIPKIAASSYGAYIYSPKLARIGNNTEIKKYIDEGVFEEKEAPPYSFGTGPYYISQGADKQRRIALKKFDDFWGGWEGAHYEKVLIEKVAEASTRETGIKGGKYDLTEMLPVTHYEDLNESTELTVRAPLTYRELYGLFNTKKWPLNNSKIRRALAWATPYQKLIEVALSGYGEVAHCPVPPGLIGYFEGIEPYRYNLTKAKEILATVTAESQAVTQSGNISLLGLTLPLFISLPLERSKWELRGT